MRLLGGGRGGAEAAVSFAVGGGLIGDSVREIEVDAAELLAPRLGLLPLRSFGGGSHAAQAEAAAHGPD